MGPDLQGPHDHGGSHRPTGASLGHHRDDRAEHQGGGREEERRHDDNYRSDDDYSDNYDRNEDIRQWARWGDVIVADG